MFLHKVVTLLGVFEGRVTECSCFFSRGTPAEPVQDRPAERVLYHIEVRTLNARRMFRELFTIKGATTHRGYMSFQSQIQSNH